MALKQVLDKLEGLDETIQSLYAKGEDGKFYLDVEGLAEQKEALRAANREALERRKALEKFRDVDPERYQELLKADEERQRQDAESKGQYDKLREQMARKHQEEIEAKSQRERLLMQALEENLVDSQATAAIAAAKGIPQLLLPHVKKRVKVHEENGAFRVQVLGPDGSPMIADASGTPATIAHLVETMKADPIYGRAFEGTGASGGGAQQSSGGVVRSMTLEGVNRLEPKARNAFFAAGGTITE